MGWTGNNLVSRGLGAIQRLCTRGLGGVKVVAKVSKGVFPYSWDTFEEVVKVQGVRRFVYYDGLRLNGVKELEFEEVGPAFSGVKGIDLRSQIEVAGTIQRIFQDALEVRGVVQKVEEATIGLEGVCERLLEEVFEVVGCKSFNLDEAQDLDGTRYIIVSEGIELLGVKSVKVSEAFNVSGKRDRTNIFTAVGLFDDD